MSTEPGWMAALASSSRYLERTSACGRERSSMLLSFERPALAGPREDAPLIGVINQRGGQPTLYASPRSLKTAQKPHSRHR